MDFNTSAWKAAAREVSFLGFHEDNTTINGCMDGVIAAHEGARTSKLGSAGLANENFTSLYELATKTLDAKSLAGIVV